MIRPLTPLAVCALVALAAGCGMPAPARPSPGDQPDIPARLDDPHEAFGLSTAALDVARLEAAARHSTRRLAAVIASPAGAPSPLPAGRRNLSRVEHVAAILPNVYSVTRDRLDAAPDGAERRVGVLAWRFDDWTDQLQDFKQADGTPTARADRSRAEARAVGSSAYDGPDGEPRFDEALGPGWGRLGGYPQHWVAMVYAVGANGRADGASAAGNGGGQDGPGGVRGGRLVAWATFDRPFRTVLWGGRANVTPLTNRAAPPGRYTLVLRPTSMLTTPPLDLRDPAAGVAPLVTR